MTLQLLLKWMTWKRCGQSSFDTGTNYGFQTILIDTASNLNNNNGTGTFVKFFGEPDQPPNRGFGVDMWLNGTFNYFLQYYAWYVNSRRHRW